MIGRLDELHSALDQLSQDMEGTQPDAKEAATMNGHAEAQSSSTKKTASEPNV